MSPVSLKHNITKPKPKLVTLDDMIERAYSEHPDNTKEAARALAEMILVDEEVFFEVMKPKLHEVCYQLLMEGNKRGREAVWNERSKSLNPRARAALTGSRDRVIGLAMSNLMLFPLPSGLKLGTATRGDIVAAADHYAKLATDTSHKSRWLTLIAQSLGDGEKVSDKFTEARLSELKKEAEHAA
jgi:hypothetical protein